LDEIARSPVNHSFAAGKPFNYFIRTAKRFPEEIQNRFLKVEGDPATRGAPLKYGSEQAFQSALRDSHCTVEFKPGGPASVTFRFHFSCARTSRGRQSSASSAWPARDRELTADTKTRCRPCQSGKAPKDCYKASAAARLKALSDAKRDIF